MTLTSDQLNEFHTTGLVRLPGAFPQDEAEVMCTRIWGFLGDRYAMERGDPASWTVDAPTGFQPVSRSGVFRPVGDGSLSPALDTVFGGGNWLRPRWWGRPLVSFPTEGAWELPVRGWHFDYMPASIQPRPVQVFAFLNAVRPGGGGTLVLSGSHRLVARYLSQGEQFRMPAVRAALADRHRWLRGLWATGDEDNRTDRYMSGTVIEGVDLRAVELVGEPGDVVVMHSDCFHAVAPNRASEPRMMLTEMIVPLQA